MDPVLRKYNPIRKYPHDALTFENRRAAIIIGENWTMTILNTQDQFPDFPIIDESMNWITSVEFKHHRFILENEE